MLAPGEFLTGFETTAMPTRGTDVLKASNHLQRYASDLQLVKAMGIQRLRYSIPGNYMYQDGLRADWSTIDGPMAAMEELGLQPIADLVHHTSAPVSILGKDFFAHADLAPWLEEYALAVLERYPWIKAITPFNEPYLTTQFCGEFGIWYPFARGTPGFIAMLLNVAKAIVRTSRAIRQHFPQVQLVYVDTCEAHSPSDPNSRKGREWAELMNHRRFLADDLVTGLVDEAHPLFEYVRTNGGDEASLRWLVEHGLRPDIRGLDYYRQSEWLWDAPQTGHWREERLGFAAVAAQYREHLGDLPLMLSETNFFGTPAERLAWHRQMVEQYCLLKNRGVDLRGYCWYPFINSVDFQHMLLEQHDDVDPVGIYDLDEERWARIPTEFTRALAEELGGDVIEPEMLPGASVGPGATLAAMDGAMPSAWPVPPKPNPEKL
jgi:hypothetical protein